MEFGAPAQMPVAAETSIALLTMRTRQKIVTRKAIDKIISVRGK
jgi:hypothetical protein